MCRSAHLFAKLTDQTVLADFFKPALQALDKIRFSNDRFLALPMQDFCLIGCLRHLKSVATMRETIQQLFHLTESNNFPVARSTYSDALNSGTRTAILQSAVTELAKISRQILPDRFEKISALGNRAIYAFDGSYQQESSHYERATPKEGGDDNPKGHMMLAAFDVRIGAPVDVATEASTRHETKVLSDRFDVEGGILRQRNAILIVDRAFVSMPMWDRHKIDYKQTSITRWKDNLVTLSKVDRPIIESDVNAGIIKDEDVQLKASVKPWRRITYLTPEQTELVFLTNELKLEPGIIAFLYLRRWDEEKCFDMWKNDFSTKKAWSKSDNGILQQALLAVMTTLLSQIFSFHQQMTLNIIDEKSLKKQEKLVDKKLTDNKQRVPWYRKFFRATSRISKQIFRFLKECYLKKSSQKLYERELKPLFVKWI